MTPTLLTRISAPTSAWMAASNSAFVTVVCYVGSYCDGTAARTLDVRDDGPVSG